MWRTRAAWRSGPGCRRTSLRKGLAGDLMVTALDWDTADAGPPPPSDRRWRRLAVIAGAVGVLSLVGIGVGALITAESAAPVVHRLIRPVVTGKGREATGVACPAFVVEIFFYPQDSPGAVALVRNRVLSWPGVEHAAFVDQRESYQEFSLLFADHPTKEAEEVTPAQLPPSERAVVTDAQTASAMKAALGPEAGVDHVTVFAGSGITSTGDSYFDVASLTRRSGIPGSPCR